jgi:molybdenum ABC transporter molybdate-binding protein
MLAPKPSSRSGWDRDWSVGVRLWLERRGNAVLGEGRADLLAQIDAAHSISGAARALGISYRHAWLMVQAVNDAAGEPLVESAVGGQKGGGARLTERGRAVLELFGAWATDVRRQAADGLKRVVAATESTATVVHLAAAISLQEAVGQILTEYALAAPTTRVHALFGASNELAEQLAAGAAIDLLLTGDKSHLARFKRKPAANAPENQSLATNGLAIVAPADSTLAAATPKELLRADLTHIAVADPASPLGQCTRAYFTKLKLIGPLEKRALYVDNSRGVTAAVRSDKAEAGIAFQSEASQDAGIRVLFRVKPAQASVAYYGVVTSNGAAAAEARKLLEFLRGDLAKRCFRRCGFGV